MTEYFAFDKSVPEDTDRSWNKQKEAVSRRQGKSFRAYFTALAKEAGVEKNVTIGLSAIGFAPPVLQVFTDDDTAKKLETASRGRVFMSKPELH